jgi:hypothetical protein
MKKLFIIAFLGSFSFSNAQKGSYLVDGSIGFNTSRSSDGYGRISDINSFSISPKIGYQYNENWTAGLQLSFSNGNRVSYNNNYPNSTNSESSKGLNYGGFLRYNKKISDIFNFFTDFNLGFNNVKNTSEYIDTFGFKNKNSEDYNGFNASIIPAVSLNIKDNFRLNFSFGGLGYSYSNVENIYGIKSFNSGFGINFGQTYAFGISKNF